jgi:hypothetical protein
MKNMINNERWHSTNAFPNTGPPAGSLAGHQTGQNTGENNNKNGQDVIINCSNRKS